MIRYSRALLPCIRALLSYIRAVLYMYICIYIYKYIYIYMYIYIYACTVLAAMVQELVADGVIPIQTVRHELREGIIFSKVLSKCHYIAYILGH